jgi:hypothetical protein
LWEQGTAEEANLKKLEKRVAKVLGGRSTLFPPLGIIPQNPWAWNFCYGVLPVKIAIHVSSIWTASHLKKMQTVR